MVPEYSTVPPAAAFIGVPVFAAISSPLCVWSLILSLAPYLEEILPTTGFTARYTPFIVDASFLASSSFSSFIVNSKISATLANSC